MNVVFYVHKSVNQIKKNDFSGAYLKFWRRVGFCKGERKGSLERWGIFMGKLRYDTVDLLNKYLKLLKSSLKIDGRDQLRTYVIYFEEYLLKISYIVVMMQKNKGSMAHRLF